MIRNLFLIGSILACASAANAQLSYDLQNNINTDYGGFATQMFSFDSVRATGVPNLVNSFSGGDYGSLLFGPDERTFQRNFTLNTAQYPSIVSASDSMTVTTQASPTRFAFSWSAAQAGQIVQPPSGITQFRQSPLSFFATIGITLTQDATLRMTWQTSASGLVGGNDFDSATPDNWSVSTVSGNALPSGFTFGYGNPSLNVTTPFSFEFTALAGKKIALKTDIELVLRNEAFSQLGTSWDRMSSGSFVIEVVPAPSAAGVLGLAGLAAARRRR